MLQCLLALLLLPTLLTPPGLCPCLCVDGEHHHTSAPGTQSHDHDRGHEHGHCPCCGAHHDFDLHKPADRVAAAPAADVPSLSAPFVPTFLAVAPPADSFPLHPPRYLTFCTFRN